ncbi:unnamed protein product [Rotaria socialis]|uniref:Reverse transcriptase domain-containing protein n=1 Tax=Rotaria socialis TaxID=392032 RepID=A0A817X9C0_9BILA|nr:unnamed protein product [Rotaria socialis]CAF4585239.1 unnamed protein product [Rotaria socialis]
MILYHTSIKCKLLDCETNFILIELSLSKETFYIGGLYVPPGSLPPFQLLSKHQNKSFYIFGDFNAKHTEWGCKNNNTSGVHLQNWLEATGNELIVPQKATSKRSDSIIDFGITCDATGWTSEVLDEGTSDHYPILFQSSISVGENSCFRITNWKIFTFFLTTIYEYWLSVVYNLDDESFFNIFSLFLTSLWDRCSNYEKVNKYRPPWPPYLVLMAKSTNRARRKYRRNRTFLNLQFFLNLKELFINERNHILESKAEKKLSWISNGHNIWKFAKPSFHSFSPPFHGLSIDKQKITISQEIVDKVADFFEEHFQEPKHDLNNPAHTEAIISYNQIEYTPNIPLEQITILEVNNEWKKFKGKKSTDSMGTSAYMLKQLPQEYITIITILFNKCTLKGNFFEASKHAKVICLSKDGLFPAVNKLRPISLLPNVGKWYERIIHTRILKWCDQNNIYVDEQSGFTAQRRLQTRIISLIEDIRLTVTACNRPALVVFVDFLSAFDRMWYPALISTLKTLEMPLSLLKWIANWLKDRTLYIQHGDALSRKIKMFVGAPQGSILAATLFKLHIHFLPSCFMKITTHLFADDLALLFLGSVEKKFSHNIIDLEIQAKDVMFNLEKYANNMLLPVNVNKTKALLVHNIISPPLPRIKYKDQEIEFVSKFKYLGVTIACKLGWGIYLNNVLNSIRKIYNAMKILFYNIPKKFISLRRKLFLAYALPHFIWMFPIWFFLTEKQKEKTYSLYCSGIRLVYGLKGWDDISTMIISQEKSLYDFIFRYWYKFSYHLETANEATQYQHTWTAYLAAKPPDKIWYRSMGLRKNNFFLNRPSARAQHSKNDWISFRDNHKKQHEYFKNSTLY